MKLKMTLTKAELIEIINDSEVIEGRNEINDIEIVETKDDKPSPDATKKPGHRMVVITVTNLETGDILDSTRFEIKDATNKLAIYENGIYEHGMAGDPWFVRC